MKEVDDLVAASKALRSSVQNDDTMVDAAGTTRKVEVELGKWRRGLTDEMMPHHQGQHYQVQEVNKGVRSYSPLRILIDYADATDQSVEQALVELVGDDVFRISVHWGNLQMAANSAGMPLRIHQGEISADEGEHHVGVYYKTDRRIVGRKETDE